MSTKKINAGDTLTAGDLTDDHLGAFIEVGPIEGLRTRLTLDRIEEAYVDVLRLFTPDGGYKPVRVSRPVTIITPPPVVQPDEPTTLGQMFRVEGLPDARGFRARGGNGLAADSFWWRRPASGTWSWDSWSTIKERVGDHRIIVSDPPRWPDETPDAPERIAVGEWPDDDTHLRAWKWIDIEDDPWWWDAQVGLWRSGYVTSDRRRPLCGPWTRGERVK